MTDSPYDPTDNPRWLDPDEPPEPVPADILDRAFQDLAVLRQVVDVSLMDGWAHIEATLQGELRVWESKLRRAEDLPSMHRAQGAVAALTWMLELPAKWAAEQQRLSDLTAQAERAGVDG